MRNLITFLFFAISILSIQAQNSDEEVLERLTEENNFTKIIELFSTDYGNLTAKSLYYVGQAFFLLEYDEECLKFINMSIEKDNQDPAAFYIKGSALNYMGDFYDAVNSFKIGLELKPDDTKLYSGLGDSYYGLNDYENAAEAYFSATQFDNCSERSFYMVGQSFYNLEQYDKSLEAFYRTKAEILPQSDYYITTLFNIGLFESLFGNHDKAEPIFTEIINLVPDDYHTYAKLIQIYYHKKEYSKAEPMKTILYEAHEDGKLAGTILEDMFCIDQFVWNEYNVLVFERYENENKGDIYNKHLFYVNDKNENLVLRVQTEFSPISYELGGPKYLLCANQENMHLNPGIGFEEGYEYDNLKAAAIKLFEKYIE